MKELYGLVLTYYGLPPIFIGVILFTIVRLIKVAYRFALAIPFGSFLESSYAGVILSDLECHSGDVQEFMKYFNENRHVPGAHLGGVLFDFIIFGMLMFILLLAWPVLFPMAILYIPLYFCRKYFMKRRIFIERLKGEAAK